MPLAAGTRLGPYEIISPLGSGGMGEVYRARDTRLERVVALKVLPDGVAASPQALERFQREARAASALNHPNICTIYDVGTDPPFIAMELLEGETLEQRLAHRPLDIAAIVALAQPIADALEAAHSTGIVHRDIKPANIFLTARGPKILDFGLAKSTGPIGTDDAAATQALLTDPGNTLGTVSYMSPEQVRAQPLDGRTDLFSFGVVLYEMTTRARPFQGESSGVIFEAILNRAPVPPARLNPNVPDELARVIDKCLEKDRELRYRHASEIRTDLHRLKRDTDQAQTPAAPLKWRPTSDGSWAPLKWRPTTAIVAAAIVLALVAGGYFYVRRSPDVPAATLTEKDTIVLADFDNKTGDAVFDDTLRQGLSVELQQSPFLSLIPDGQVQQQLKLMGQPKDARLTPDVAQQICERTASAVVLEGSISSLGSQYVLGLRAKNCNTGQVLDAEQIQAARREDVLNSLSAITGKLRTRLGESRATVEEHSTPLAEATTPSLDALKAYSSGIKATVSNANGSEIGFYRRAIDIDPKFAMAHAQLGLTYSSLGESVLASQSTTKAWQLRDRVSDRERFFIDFTYARQVTGNLEKAYQTLELWLHTYPRGNRQPAPLGLLGSLSTHGTGRYERAIDASQKYIAMSPNDTVAYSALAQSYFLQDRLPDAESTIRRAAELHLDMPLLLMVRFNIAMLKDDQQKMDREVALARGIPKAEHWMDHEVALALARSGRLQAAQRSSSLAMDRALRAEERESAASYQAARATWEAIYGKVADAKKDAVAALALSNGRDVEYAAAFALALAGDTARSQSLADDLDKRFPEDTFAKFSYVPVLRALAALERGKPADGVEALQIALPYELAVNGLNFNHFYLGGLHSAYVRGEALVAAHRYAEAAAEFQKVLDHRGLVGADPIGPLAHVQLGRTWALSGDTVKAKAAYQDFFTLWKDADVDVPVLKQAKAEFAKLH